MTVDPAVSGLLGMELKEIEWVLRRDAGSKRRAAQVLGLWNLAHAARGMRPSDHSHLVLAAPRCANENPRASRSGCTVDRPNRNARRSASSSPIAQVLAQPAMQEDPLCAESA
jgi:hypothetical protein